MSRSCCSGPSCCHCLGVHLRKDLWLERESCLVGVIAVDFQLQLGNKEEDGGGFSGSSLYRG